MNASFERRTLKRTPKSGYIDFSMEVAAWIWLGSVCRAQNGCRNVCSYMRAHVFNTEPNRNALLDSLSVEVATWFGDETSHVRTLWLDKNS